MTFFTYKIPQEFTLRVWDAFLFEPRIVYLILLNIIKKKEKKLLNLIHDVRIKLFIF